MRQEVSSAVDFITNILRNHELTKSQLEDFRNTLNNLLINHYEDHWFPEKPCKGSGYRCIRINHKMDPIVARAGSTIGLREAEMFLLLPSELTLWVDPEEVSYRIGEEGSIGVLYGQDSSSSSSGSDSESSRTPSPVSYQPSNARVFTPQSQRSRSNSPMYHSGQYYSPASSSPVHFMQSCKDQLRYHLPETDNMPDYLSSFMAS